MWKFSLLLSNKINRTVKTINKILLLKNTSESFQTKNFFIWLIVFFIKNVFIEFPVLRDHDDNVNQRVN